MSNTDQLDAEIDMDQQHKWRNSYRGSRKVDPNEAAKVLNTIYQRDGTLKAQAIVDEARPKSSPIHEGFEWRDKVAANEHRKWQARHMVRNVEIVRPEKPQAKPGVQTVEVQRVESTAQAYYYVGEGNLNTPAGYYPAEVVKQDFDLFDRAMQDAQRALRGAEKRVEDLKQLAKQSDQPERMAQIAIAAEALSTAQAALASVSH